MSLDELLLAEIGIARILETQFDVSVIACGTHYDGMLKMLIRDGWMIGKFKF